MRTLAKNLRHLRQQHNLTQEDLADTLGITRSRIGSYEENRSEPPLEIMIKLSAHFGLPIDALVKNDLTSSKDKSFIDIGNHRVLFPVIVSDSNEDIIEVVPVKASAGYLNGYSDPEYIEKLQQIRLPFIPTGKHRAFPIKGDSMLPIREGSWVIGKFMENIGDIRSGRTYVLLTRNEGIVYKRVYNQLPERPILLLSSDNKAYDPYEVPISDILEVWEFTCSIRTQEYDETELKVESIMKMLRELQVELQPLKNM